MPVGPPAAPGYVDLVERADFPYKQLASRLRETVAQLGPDEQLPSITRLCQETGLSVKTIRKALALLAAEGRIYTVAGLGSFKSAEPPTS